MTDKAMTAPNALSKLRGAVGRFFAVRESVIFVTLLFSYGLVWFLSPIFRTMDNHVTILRQISQIAVLSIGQTMVILSGGIDLSQGPVAALVGMLCGWSIRYWGFSPGLAIALGLLAGVACGALNAAIVTRLRFEPAVATLASSSLITGVMYYLTKGRTVYGLPAAFNWLGGADIGLVPVSFIAMVVLYLIMHFVLTQTRFGRHIHIIGCNKDAARLAGIDVERIQVGVYMFSSFFAALTGIMLTGRTTTAVTTMGSGLMLPTIAAAVIGGTSLAGGVGSMAGTLMGTSIMAILRNAIVVLHLNIYWQDGVAGIVTVIAVVIDQLRQGTLSLESLLPRKRHVRSP
jgi:ribose transport system permease protein